MRRIIRPSFNFILLKKESDNINNRTRTLRQKQSIIAPHCS